VALVVLAEEQALLPVEVRAHLRSSSRSSVFWKSFSRSHTGMAMRKGEAARREGQVGLQQPLELQERLVVEGDVVDLVELDPGSSRQNATAFCGKPDRASCA
jgi:hypothetical protein